MGFRIHVAASGGFRHSRSGVAYGDEWELSWLETQILSRGFGIGQRASATGRGTGVGVMAMSRIHQLHLLIDSIAMIMTHGNGNLHVSISHSHILWPNTGGYLNLPLSGGDPGRIARELCRCLDRHGMNRWGPIIEILDAFTRFETHYTGRAGYIINVTLLD